MMNQTRVARTRLFADCGLDALTRYASDCSTAISQTTGSSEEAVSLRARLTLYFVIIVVLPVTAVTAYGWQAVARSTDRQVRSQLEMARGAATVALTARFERAHEAVAALAATRRCSRPWRPGTRPSSGWSSAARGRRTCSWP